MDFERKKERSDPHTGHHCNIHHAGHHCNVDCIAWWRFVSTQATIEHVLILPSWSPSPWLCAKKSLGFTPFKTPLHRSRPPPSPAHLPPTSPKDVRLWGDRRHCTGASLVALYRLETNLFGTSFCSLPGQRKTEKHVGLDPRNCPGPGDRSIPNGIPKHIPNEWVKQLTCFWDWHVLST